MAPGLFRTATLALRAASTTVCPTSPICPQDDKCTYATGGVALAVSCATDYYGGDLQLAQTSTLTGCMKACSLTDGCVAASYVGENCYMKSVLNSASENANVIGVSVTARESTGGSTVETPQTCPSSYTCPEDNGCTFKGTDLRSFTLACDIDYYGGDLLGQYAQSYQACTRACSDNADCVAASFTGGKSDGYCYLKSKNNGPIINNNVNAVFLDIRVTPSSTTSSTISSSSIAPSSTLITSSSTIPDASISGATFSSSGTLSTSSLMSSTPIVSSSSIIPSTAITPSVTPTPTPLLPGPNVLTNAGFESNGGTGSNRITDWVVANSAYPVVQARYAHGGQTYIVLSTARGRNPELSQTINDLDVSRSYQFSFWLAPYQNFVNVVSCQLDILANDNVVYTKSFGSADASGSAAVVSYRLVTTSPFEITSAQQTIKFRYQCTYANGQNSGSAYIIVDDADLHAV